MEDNQFGITLKIKDVGYVKGNRVNNLHGAKSVAGKAFHKPYVESVCVYDAKGVARLYLKRIEGGYIREERN